MDPNPGRNTSLKAGRSLNGAFRAAVLDPALTPGVLTVRCVGSPVHGASR
jgi:hypothetical protein